MGAAASSPAAAVEAATSHPTRQLSSVTSNTSPGIEVASTSSSSCPVPEQYRSSGVYNVYNQRVDDSSEKPSSLQSQQDLLARILGYERLDPSNNMPIEPNQLPCAGQKVPLSTQRLASSIPKGGTDSTWVYPSPQMFYNALKRKGKGDDVTEEVMDEVVHAHNTMNEMTWRQVQQWEALHAADCGRSKLLRFQGRPGSLSPLARLQSLTGGPLPFDRHDWWVDRCGKEVRYVIDFYFDDDKAGSPEAFSLRVRPALDSFEASIDRAKMSIYTTFAKYGLPCPVTGHSGQFSSPANKEAADLPHARA